MNTDVTLDIAGNKKRGKKRKKGARKQHYSRPKPLDMHTVEPTSTHVRTESSLESESSHAWGAGAVHENVNS